MVELSNPLWLVVLIPVVIGWLYQHRIASARVPTLPLADASSGSRRRGGMLFIWTLPITVRWLALAILAVGLARPRLPDVETRVLPKGIAIVIAVDTSLSMVVRDFGGPHEEVSRLEGVKRVARDFVEGLGEFSGRAADQIGVVSFANFPDVECPPTLNHRAVLDSIARLRPAPVQEQGTNIGDGIIAALDLLRGTDARSRVLVLLTDGVNEPAPLADAPPPIEPEEAGRLAARMGVRIYTIGTGVWHGRFWYRDPDTGVIHTPEAKPMNRRLLRQLASMTGGKFWVADNLKKLESIMEELDRLEPAPLGPIVYRDYYELFPWCAGAAVVLLALELLMRCTRWRLLYAPPLHWSGEGASEEEPVTPGRDGAAEVLQGGVYVGH